MKMPLGIRDREGNVIHHNDVVKTPGWDPYVVRPSVSRHHGGRDEPPYTTVGWCVTEPEKSLVIGNIEDDPTLLNDKVILKSYLSSFP